MKTLIGNNKDKQVAVNDFGDQFSITTTAKTGVEVSIYDKGLISGYVKTVEEELLDLGYTQSEVRQIIGVVKNARGVLSGLEK